MYTVLQLSLCNSQRVQRNVYLRLRVGCRFLVPSPGRGAGVGSEAPTNLRFRYRTSNHGRRTPPWRACLFDQLKALAPAASTLTEVIYDITWYLMRCKIGACAAELRSTVSLSSRPQSIKLVCGNNSWQERRIHVFINLLYLMELGIYKDTAVQTLR